MLKNAKAQASSQVPENATAVLVFGDGTVFYGRGIGAEVEKIGEICFNTSLTGYQEILTDPSYAGQIITFTFPHIGNVGTNSDDIETINVASCGAIIREDITDPSNYRNTQHFNEWLKSHDLPGICGIDTRAMTRHIRDNGAPNGILCHRQDGKFDIEDLKAKAAAWSGIEGLDLAKEVSCTQTYAWDETLWDMQDGHGKQESPDLHVVAMDFGAKRNILRCLASAGCDVTVLPATATTEDVLALNPDGLFLSNGPGDPAATGAYAVPMIQGVLDQSDIPVFGICLGHQMLALALGAKTVKMNHGHHGANHPVKDIETGKVEITSMNHGFTVDSQSLPNGVMETHVSLFDGSNCGIRMTERPVFSVQYHPEASPGPVDSMYLFERFAAAMAARKSVDA